MLLQAIRSGVINAEDSYRFEVPSSYREVGVANIQSGNFCMVLLHYHPAHASKLLSFWEHTRFWCSQIVLNHGQR